MKKTTWLIILFCALVFSCSQSYGTSRSKPEEEPEEPAVVLIPRVEVFSQDSDTAQITVELENEEGNLVSGAVVLVHDNLKATKRLAFDATSFSYKTSFPIPADGILKITVKSNYTNQTDEFEVHHDQIHNKPAVVLFEDFEGSSVLNGQAINPLLDIQAAWDSAGEGIIYKVMIKGPFSTIYETTTEAQNITIPGGTLNTQNNIGYTLQVVAQKLYGDPYFIDEHFYSCSMITGDRVAFGVK